MGCKTREAFSSQGGDDSWLDTLSHNRRFPKRGAIKHTGTGGTTKGVFNVRNILGTYAVKFPVIERDIVSLSREVNGEEQSAKEFGPMRFEIHGLVQRPNGVERYGRRSAEEVEALLGSFDFGIISGMCLIGGSRRGLREVVQMVEDDEANDDDEDDEDDDNGEEDEDETEGDEIDDDGQQAEHGEVEVEDDEADHGDTEEEEEEEERQQQQEPPSSSSDNYPTPPPRPLFSKNTFRTPKFFFEWRGHDQYSAKHSSANVQNVTRGPSSDHMGHLEFTDHACKDFKGTFSSERWGKDVKFHGWKSNSRPTECPYVWGQFETDP